MVTTAAQHLLQRRPLRTKQRRLQRTAMARHRAEMMTRPRRPWRRSWINWLVAVVEGSSAPEDEAQIVS